MNTERKVVAPPLSRLDINYALFALQKDLKESRGLLARMEARGEADDDFRELVSEAGARVARFEAASMACDFRCSDPVRARVGGAA